MFKRLWRWLFPVVEDATGEPPWPEDVWLRMDFLADRLRGSTFPPLCVDHFDIGLSVTTTSMHQLFRRIEIMLNCIDNLSDVPDWWGERQRDKREITFVDYHFDTRNGYRDLQQSLDKLIEKVSVIHHLIESQRIIVTHDYYHYLRREFFQVVSDIVEVLTAADTLRTPQ